MSCLRATHDTMRLIMGDATARPGAVRTVAALLVLSLSPTGAVLLTRNRLARSRAPGPSALSGWQPLPLASTSFFSLPVHDAGELSSVVLPKIDSDKGEDSAAATAKPLDTAHGGFLVDTVYSVFLAKIFCLLSSSSRSRSTIRPHRSTTRTFSEPPEHPESPNLILDASIFTHGGLLADCQSSGFSSSSSVT